MAEAGCGPARGARGRLARRVRHHKLVVHTCELFVHSYEMPCITTTKQALGSCLFIMNDLAFELQLI